MSSRRCNSSIQSIIIDVQDELVESDKEELQTVVSQSSQSIRVLIVSRQKDLELQTFQIAIICHSLKYLESRNLGHESILYPGSSTGRTLKFPASWNPHLIQFVWVTGQYQLELDSTMIERLKYSRTIRLSDGSATSA